MARPRKLGRRKKCGRLYQEKTDTRLATALTRVRDFGVTVVQSVNPLAGYLAGVMYLRGEIESQHLGHYFSFCQLVPVHTKAIHYGVRVSGGKVYDFRVRKRYMLLSRVLGRDINILHELMNDRLICSVARLKNLLVKVPLTAGGSAFINWCETQHPKMRSNGNSNRGQKAIRSARPERGSPEPSPRRENAVSHSDYSDT